MRQSPEGYRISGKVFSLIHQKLKFFSALNDDVDVRHHYILHLVYLCLYTEKLCLRRPDHWSLQIFKNN